MRSAVGQLSDTIVILLLFLQELSLSHAGEQLEECGRSADTIVIFYLFFRTCLQVMLENNLRSVLGHLTL